MKQLTSIILLFVAGIITAKAQTTNTFPTTGDVGIETISPMYKLDVIGEGRIAKTIITSSNSPSSILFSQQGFHNMFGVDGTWTNKYFGIKTNGDFLTMGGNVGIGTSTPTEKLSVNVKIRAKEIKVENARHEKKNRKA